MKRVCFFISLLTITLVIIGFGFNFITSAETTTNKWIENTYLLKDEEGNYYNANTITEIEIPNTITRIVDYQFSGFNNLTKVIIPNSVTSIGNYAFYNCTNLQDVYYIGTIEDWYKIQFDSWSSNPMYYADNLYLLDEEGKYYNANQITKIEIPNTIISIGDYQFFGFDNLQRIIIPNSVTSIGYYAFLDCIILLDVYYNGTIEDWCKINFANEYSNPMYYAKHVYMLDENNEYYEVTEIEIPNTITSIGKYQFYGFDNLTKVIIPNSVRSIGDRAFYSCSSLESITIPNSVTSIGHYPFLYCTSLESIIVEEGNPVYHSDNNCLIETATKTLILGCANSVIPTDGSVTNIGNDAFWFCDNLQSIIITSSVTSIGDSAFVYCTSLKEVIFEEGSQLTSIGSGAFRDCTSLESITIPNSVTSIGDLTFWDCTNLKDVIFEEGSQLTSIGDGAFQDCPSLQSITIPNSVTSIGNAAFYDCPSLETVYFKGTEEEWDNISIEAGNNPLLSANIIFSCYQHNYIETAERQYLKLEATCTTPAVYYYNCSKCGKVSRETFEHGEYVSHNHVNGVCTECGDKIYDFGDLNDDVKVNSDDAIYLLMYTLFPDDYPTNQPCDFNKDGTVNTQDAIHLLMHSLFPDDYPLE